MGIYRFSLLCLFLLLSQSAFSQVYQWVDENGRVQFSDKAPVGTNQASVGEQVDDRKKQESTIKPLPPTADLDAVGNNEWVTVRLRKLLKEKRFKELNSILYELQVAAETNIANEEALFVAYEAFDIKDESYSKYFNSWVTVTPGNYQSFIARAYYYYSLGWFMRGTKWASEIKQGQFDKMNFYFEKALEDSTKAMNINDNSMVAYLIKIGIYNGQGKDGEVESVARQAFKISPATFRVRSMYMHSLTPRWGGSFDEMQSFIDESLVHGSKNKRLALLEGFILAEAGSLSAIMDKNTSAEKHYTEALKFGDYHKTYSARGRSRYRQEKYKDALKDFKRAIELYSESADYYYWRTKTYMKLDNFDSAMIDIQYAHALDPEDKKINSRRKKLASKFTRQGSDLMKNNESPSLAIEKYNNSLLLNSESGYTYYKRARAYIALRELDKATTDLKTAIKIKPDDISYYQLLDYILVKRGDWDQIISYWDAFIERNKANGRAYLERGGAYYHKGDIESAVKNAKISAELGDLDGQELYDRYKHLVSN